MKGAGGRKWAALAAVLAALLASAYFWWWKPVVLASIRFALEGALAKSSPAISFGSLDLSGVGTVVVKNVNVGKLDQDFSATAREARFAFSLWHLVTGRFDVVRSLRQVALVDPQVMLTIGPAAANGKPGSPGLRLPAELPAFPRHARLDIRNGRLLLRARGIKTTFSSVTDIDARIFLPEPGSMDFEAKLTAPESPRRGVSVRAVLAGPAFTLTAALKKLRFAPFVPWLKPLKLPVTPELGSLSCTLRAAFTRSCDGRWIPSLADGRADLDGVALAVAGVPFRLREITGTVRFADTDIRVPGIALKAEDTDWKVIGDITNIGSPELHLRAEAKSFTPGKFLKDSEGTGSLAFSAEGPASNPAIGIEPDITGFKSEYLSCALLQGRYVVEDWGRRVRLEPARIGLAAGIFSATGTVEPSAPAGDLAFTFTPGGTGLPSWSGVAKLIRNSFTLAASSSDGRWTADGKASREGDSWTGSVAARSSSGARLAVSGRAGARAPNRLAGTVSLVRASPADLYLAGAWAPLGRLEGRTNAAGSISGSAREPVLALEISGGSLTMEGRKLALTGPLRVDSGGLRAGPLKLGEHTTINARVPAGAGPTTAKVAMEGTPLALILALARAPAWAVESEGTVHGAVSTEVVDGHAAVRFNTEARELSWRGNRLGLLQLAGEGKDGTFKASKFRLNGPACSAEGACSLTPLASGDWDASASLTVNYLKRGNADLECRAALTGASRDGARSLDAALSSIRVSGTAYSDATVSLKAGTDGALSIRLSWEDVIYANATLKADAARTVAFNAALTDFPVAPAAGAFSLPPPAERLSGSLNLKGPRDHAVLAASLKWERGEGEIRGWVDAAKRERFSLTLSAFDTGAAGWLPFLRAVLPGKSLPEANGRVEARSLALDMDGGRLAANGWVGARDLRVGGVACGNGSLRVTSAGGRSEFEGSLEGPQGKYTLYPTRYDDRGERKTVEGALAWSGLPAGKAVLSCARASFTAGWRGAEAAADLELSSLGLGNHMLDKLTVRAERSGKLWRLSSPRGSPWQVIGTVSVEGTRLSAVDDERAGGPSLLVRGGVGVAMKVGGTWAVPAVPERFSLEAHNLLAAPLLEALGAPPARGTAEADLDWDAKKDPPMSGRITLLGACWGDFPCDTVDARISGTPGRSFTLTTLRLTRGEEITARGSGTLLLLPVQSIKLSLIVERFLLRYLKPLGFINDSDVVATGKVDFSGEPGNIRMDGALSFAPGSVTPRTGFAMLYLTEGRLDFAGTRANLSAALNDITGAPLLVSGAAEMKNLAPVSFTLALDAPKPVKVDAIPDLFKGTARGKVEFTGTPDAPTFRGEVTLEEGRLKTPPAPAKGSGGLAERLAWDLAVKFGSGVKYVIGGTEGAAIELATLSPQSHVSVKGKGDDFRVTGAVLADSGPLTLFLGKQLWKK